MIGTTLNNRYHLEAELGHGGMGVVYRARDLSLNRGVAIKVLPPEFSMDTQFLQRFKNEVLNVAKLDHPNIVQIYDVGQEGNTNYYVMQLVEGSDLHDAILQRGRFSLEDTIRITKQVAMALDYAHEQGIVHRDIKPDNILLDINGYPRVVDFGIAKTVEGTRMTGGMIGTPEYMSPEQARGEALDGRADQYALAIVVYEMLTGTTPFRSIDTQPWALVNKHISVPPPDPREYQCNLPEYAALALMRALSKVANYRFNKCSDFAKTLCGEVINDATMIYQKDASPTLSAANPQEIKINETIISKPLMPEKPKSKDSGKLILFFLTGLFFIVGMLIIKPGSTLTQPPPPPITPTPSLQRLIPDDFSASTVMSPITGKKKVYYYYPQLAFDDDPLTSWSPPTGEWENAYIEATFSSPVTVSQLRIMPGLDRDGYWWKNNRLKSASIEFDGSRKQEISFLDERRLQNIEVSPAETASVIRIKVISIYPGSRWDDVMISTIQVWGYR